jgi:hypothetical protein
MPARLPRGGGRQDPRRLTESIPGFMHTSVHVIGVLPDRLLSEVFDRGFCRWASRSDCCALCIGASRAVGWSHPDVWLRPAI